MTDAEKLEILETLLGDGGDIPDEATLQAYLTLAGNEILHWKYHLIGGVPDTVTSVPESYDGTQIYAVIAGYTHAGAEGQRVHNENGINRTFAYDDMLDYIHNKVTPYARVGAVSTS